MVCGWSYPEYNFKTTSGHEKQKNNCCSREKAVNRKLPQYNQEKALTDK